RMAALMEADLGHPAGRKAFEGRKLDRGGLYNYEQRKRVRFGAEDLKRFKASRKGWSYWEAQPAGYHSTATFWVMSAKREATRERRLATLIQDSAAGRRIAPLRRP
ncbi:MAG: YdeI/OmpD-associated family protein, partial [Gemmatimonadota bacterium]